MTLEKKLWNKVDWITREIDTLTNKLAKPVKNTSGTRNRIDELQAQRKILIEMVN